MCIFNFIYFFEKVVVGGGGGGGGGAAAPPPPPPTHPPLPLRGPWNGLSLKAVLVTVLNWAFGNQFWMFICAVDNLIFFSEDILTRPVQK